MFDVRAYGARGDGNHDDTAAIVSAVKAATLAGGGTILFPAGVYLLAGPLSAAENGNALVPLPYMPIRDTVNKPIVLEFRGETPAPTGYLYMIPGSGSTPPTGGSVLVAASAPAGPAAAIVGGPAAPADPRLPGHTRRTPIYAVFRNLTFRQPANPGLRALDLAYAAWAKVEDCAFDVDSRLGPAIRRPEDPNGVALTLPVNNNGAYTAVRDCFVIGYRVAIDVGEHAIMDGVSVGLCEVAFRVHEMHHAFNAGRILSQWCPRVLQYGGNGAPAYGHVTQLDSEDAEPDEFWYSSAYHVDDPEDLIHASVRWHRVLRNVGTQFGALTRNGGRHVEVTLC